MSRGIGRDRSDIFHLRKNGASFRSHYHGQKWAITFHSRISRTIRYHAVLSSSRRVFYVFFGSQSLVNRLFLLYFLPFSILSKVGTFEGVREPMESGMSWKKTGGGTDAFSPGITPIKTPPRGGNSSSILPKSDRWQERLLLRLSTYKRYKHGYSYFLSPRSAVYIRGKEGGVVSLILSSFLSSSKYLSCRSVIYHGPCPLKDFNSGRRPPFGERFSIRSRRSPPIDFWIFTPSTRESALSRRICSPVTAKETRATRISSSDHLIRFNGSKAV